jgi:hypothetical protein
MWRWIWTVEQADSYHQRSGQVVLLTTERLHAKQWQFATRGQDRLFYSLMTCSKYEILYTDVLDCGTWNLIACSQALYSYDCCLYVACGMSDSQVIYSRYIMTRRALLHLTSSGVQYNCFTAGSSVITRGETNNSALDCLDLADALILSWAPICKCVFQRWSHKCEIALGFDVCWSTTDVSAREGQGVVCLLSHFIDVYVRAKVFKDVQTQVLGGVDVFSTCPWMVYLDCSGVLVVICRTL